MAIQTIKYFLLSADSPTSHQQDVEEQEGPKFVFPAAKELPVVLPQRPTPISYNGYWLDMGDVALVHDSNSC